VYVDHVILPKKFEKELNNFGRTIITKQPTKMRPNISTTISSFFGSTTPFKIDEPQQKEFLEDLALVIITNHLLMQFVESVVEKMCNAFMSEIVVSIQKAILSKSFA